MLLVPGIWYLAFERQHAVPQRLRMQPSWLSHMDRAAVNLHSWVLQAIFLLGGRQVHADTLLASWPSIRDGEHGRGLLISEVCLPQAPSAPSLMPACGWKTS